MRNFSHPCSDGSEGWVRSPSQVPYSTEIFFYEKISKSIIFPKNDTDKKCNID